MVSTIANGGVYLPPHVLMPGQVDGTDPNQRTAAAKAVPFKPGGDLPNPLPPGAHRVLSTLTAAQMRKMMEGVVLYGTGRQAQLNGYSSGGKTGTAQKIDPATHLYSKSLHVASFAGIAPINNPVISVAVIIDSPKGAYYGAAISAPVFAEVAQQILEYLGVAHDIDLRTPRAQAQSELRLAEDESADHTGDINALYNAANDLPTDDPWRASSTPTTAASQPEARPPTASKANAKAQANSGVKQAVVVPAALQKGVGTKGGQGQPRQLAAEVTISSVKRLKVPSLIGLPVRKVIEQAAAAGLEVQISGNGTVREQAPAAGTAVEPGTKIVVRCGR
jgi:cell division protein FtsI (penicillin-binding protein 3)